MAANSSKARMLTGTFGKRFSNQIWTRTSPDPAPIPSFPASRTRRGVHLSSYDKNVDDQIRPTVVPDDVIRYSQSDKYWGPHPKTGVFGPAAEHNGAVSESGGDHSHVSTPGSESGSVLNQTVWFRPLEDVDKPPPHA